MSKLKKGCLRSIIVVMAVPIIGIIAVIIAVQFCKPVDEVVFRERILDPMPESVKELNLEYKGWREWFVKASFQMNSNEFDRLLQSKKFELLEEDCYQNFAMQYIRSSHWPAAEELPAYEVYADYSRRGKVCYFITDKEHQQYYIFLCRL